MSKQELFRYTVVLIVGIAAVFVFVPHSTAKRCDPPEWYMTQPTHPDFYFGVGMALKNEFKKENQKDQAIENAKKQLAATVCQTIEYGYEETLYESTGEFPSDFSEVESHTKVFSRLTLSGVEVDSIFDTGCAFYAKVRISRDTAHKMVLENLRLLTDEDIERVAGKLVDTKSAQLRSDLIGWKEDLVSKDIQAWKSVEAIRKGLEVAIKDRNLLERMLSEKFEDLHGRSQSLELCFQSIKNSKVDKALFLEEIKKMRHLINQENPNLVALEDHLKTIASKVDFEIKNKIDVLSKKIYTLESKGKEIGKLKSELLTLIEKQSISSPEIILSEVIGIESQIESMEISLDISWMVILAISIFCLTALLLGIFIIQQKEPIMLFLGEDFSNKKSDFLVRVWATPANSNSGRYQVRDIKTIPSNNKIKYRIGDHIFIHIQSERSGYLLLLNKGASGNTSVLFPNEFHQDGRIEKGITYSFPTEEMGFDLQLFKPSGVEEILAVVTESFISPSSFIPKVGEIIKKIDNPSAVRDIKVVRKKLNESNTKNWSTGKCTIMVND